MATGFTIQLDALDHNLHRFDERARKAIDKTMTYQAARSETYMKTNAKWTDRTTNARNGLFVSVVRHGEDSWEMILSHGVSYGIWLEVLNNGRYAIVRPAFLRAGKQTMQLLSRLFERMEK
jgi:hypothetical protein